ncbi:MAG: hypothetical protein LWX56_08635 [Ignavibacteria bacterium]|nr:hypothetical protein [Ignavibacteria bacterium]
MAPQSLEDFKCIWMSSGVIDYRLCDLDFDCDNCAFDLAMKKRTPPQISKPEVKANLFDKLRSRNEQFSHSDNMVVLSNSLVLRHVFQNSYMLGFSSFLWDLLEPVQQIHCSIEKGYYRKGDTFMNLQGEWGAIAIPAPFDLFVVSTFVTVMTPLQHGSWMGFIEVDDENVNGSTISKTEYAARTTEIVGALSREYDMSPGMLTMQDGGTPVQFLFQIMGTKPYKQLLAKLLNF